MAEKKSDNDKADLPPEEAALAEVANSRRPFRDLPFSFLWPLLAGASAGIALRLVFSGKPGSPYAAMMSAFIYFSPVIVGAVTVYVAERRKRRSWEYYLWASFLANCIYVAGTLVIMIEGLICAVIIVPFFAAFGALGGLIMGAFCRLTNWPKQALYSVAILPFILGSLETGLALPERVGTVERAIVINAPPDHIWRNILNVPSIAPEEIDRAWLFRIGVPLTQAGFMRATSGERVRRVTMGKNIYFDEVITDWQDYRYLRWTYRYYEDSFPPYALDDHVMLGGKYFDIKDTSYALTPRGDRTELKVTMQYRVSTSFNWYADPVARFLLGNLAEINLDYYRHRSELQRGGKTGAN